MRLIFEPVERTWSLSVLPGGSKRGWRRTVDYQTTSYGIAEFTKPQSNGHPVNPHVVRYAPPPEPDYEKMRDLAHNPPPPAKPQEEE